MFVLLGISQETLMMMLLMVVVVKLMVMMMVMMLVVMYATMQERPHTEFWFWCEWLKHPSWMVIN